MSNKKINETPVTQSGAVAPKADASPDDPDGQCRGVSHTLFSNKQTNKQ